MLRLGVANDMSSLSPSLQDCLETVLSISDSMIDDLLEGLSATVDPERAAHVRLAHGSVDPAVVERLISKAEALKKTFGEHLRHALYHGSEIDSMGRPPLRFEDLRLLDEQQIDATIGFALAEQELAQVCADVLPRLNALLSGLMGWMTVQADLNPLKPAAFARALREVLVRHVPDKVQRSALFTPAAGVLADSLRQVYKELIQWLLVHGVEPIEARPQRQERVPRGAVGRTLLTLGRLRQLLAGDLDNPLPDGARHEFLHTVPVSMTALEDMDMVEPLIQRLRARASQPADEETAAELPIVPEQSLGRLLGQEVVRLMLDNLTKDERLLPAIRQQIGLLEPVLIRLSHDDPRFFSERQHPARLLLEAITQRSLGYLSQDDDGFSELLHSVVAAVRSINRVEATEEVFARLLRRLRRRWDEDDARKNQLRSEAARALQHAEQRHLLAERLAAEFELNVREKDVPGFVRDFLAGPWAQAVAEAQLSGALNDADGVPVAAVTDDLIWSVQPELIRRDRYRLAKLVPRMLGQLRHGLKLIEYPPDRVGQFFDAMVALHEQASEQPKPEVVVDQAAPVEMPTLVDQMDQLPAPAAKTFWMAGSEAVDAGYVSEESGPMPLQPVDLGSGALATGAWVDLLIQGEWVRAELTWASPHGTLFMFVSARGLAHSMTRRTLDRLRKTNILRVVSSGGVVEGALDAVAEAALRNASEEQVDS